MAATFRIISFGALIGTAFLGIAALQSCSGNGFNFQGKWVGRREPATPPSKSESPQFNTFGKIELKIGDNGRFEMIQFGIPSEGRVRYADGDAYLRIELLFGRPIEEQGQAALKRNHEIELVPQKDGTLRLTDPGGFDTSPVVLKREPQPEGKQARKGLQETDRFGGRMMHPFDRDVPLEQQEE